MVSVMLYPCKLCVAMSMDLFVLCVACLTLDSHIWSSIECVCCACGPSERLDAPSIMFCLCFCMSEVISSFRSLRAGSQVFALLMLFLWVFCTGKSMQLLCIFHFGMLCLSAISMMLVKIRLAVFCILVGMVV